MKFLDCFCGLGGASEGFHREGFDCTGIDIVDMGYPYKLIVADMRMVKGEDFRGYDVIWGSPPCVDFSTASCPNKTRVGRTAPDPDKGLKLLEAFRRVVDEAQPIYWFMENVFRATKFYTREKPALIFYTSIKGKRALWSNFTFPLMNDIRPQRRLEEEYKKLKWWKQSALKAKIPLACSLAFARACKEQLGKEPKNI